MRTFLFPALILQITLCISNVPHPHYIFRLLYLPPYTPVFTLRTTKFNNKKEKQCAYNITLRRVRATNFAVEKQ